MANKRPVGPWMADLSMWEKAGVDPKTGLPSRMVDCDTHLKTEIKHALRIKDEQDAVNRYAWYNLPLKITPQEVERRLYYNHHLAFFYFEELEEFCLMPFAMDSGLDFYGRPTYIHPVPYASGNTEEDKASYKRQEDYLRSIKLKVIYDVQVIDNFMREDGTMDEDKMRDLLTHSAVIINDYTPQESLWGTPRAQLQDSILDVMADCIPFSRTALLNSTGIQGIIVDDETQAAAVYGFSNSVNMAALSGKKYLPIKTAMAGQIQELTGGNVAKSEEFLQMMQGYNNYRLGLYGLDNNGLYDKKAYVNNMQSGVNNVGLSLQDGITQRQNACNIINSIWGIMVWCDISETVSGLDKNLDGQSYDTAAPSPAPQSEPTQEAEE